MEKGETRAIEYDLKRGALGFPNGFSEKRKRKNEPVKCTECESQAIEYDDIRSEYVCLDCGLVLSGPPAYVAGLFMIDYPWGNNYLSDFEMETINGEHVIAWYGP